MKLFDINNNIEQIRYYALVEHKGVRKLACRIDNEDWIIDKVCSHVNALLSEGKVTEAHIIKWLDVGSRNKFEIN